MDTVTGDVLLVGSVPLNSAEEVLRVCAEGVGDLVPSLPDGEVNFRIEWINFLAAKIYSEHPSLETTSRPKDVDGKPGWVPTGYDDHWIFKVKPGLDSVHFDNLGYAAQAKNSYETFRALRQEGVIPANVRFQVSLPLTESATRWFLTNAEDFAILWDAYEEAMGRELATIQSDIPTDDLLIQWDICMEVLAIDTNDQREGLSAWVPPGDPLDRYLRAITAVAAHVVDEVPMGLHLCYGDLLHAHLVEPKDLGVVVGIANDSVREIERQVDFVHVPVPRGRDDDAYFQPLADLDIGAAKLFIGLVHHTDGVDGGLRRLATAKKYAAGFGIATECGLGRRPPETIKELLQIHRGVAKGL